MYVRCTHEIRNVDIDNITSVISMSVSITKSEGVKTK